MIREDVVCALVCSIGELEGEPFGQLLHQATAEEITAATRRLRDAALTAGRAPDVLSLDLWTTAKLIMQGRCLEWVSEQLPQWRPWPGKSLSTVLKTESPETVARVRSALRSAGLAVDEGPTGEADDHGLGNDAGP